MKSSDPEYQEQEEEKRRMTKKVSQSMLSRTKSNRQIVNPDDAFKKINEEKKRSNSSEGENPCPELTTADRTHHIEDFYGGDADDSPFKNPLRPKDTSEFFTPPATPIVDRKGHIGSPLSLSPGRLFGDLEGISPIKTDHSSRKRKRTEKILEDEFEDEIINSNSKDQIPPIQEEKKQKHSSNKIMLTIAVDGYPELSNAIVRRSEDKSWYSEKKIFRALGKIVKMIDEKKTIDDIINIVSSKDHSSYMTTGDKSVLRELDLAAGNRPNLRELFKQLQNTSTGLGKEFYEIKEQNPEIFNAKSFYSLSGVDIEIKPSSKPNSTTVQKTASNSNIATVS